MAGEIAYPGAGTTYGIYGTSSSVRCGPCVSFALSAAQARPDLAKTWSPPRLMTPVRRAMA